MSVPRAWVVSQMAIKPTQPGHQSITGMGGSRFDYDRTGGGPGSTNMVF